MKIYKGAALALLPDFAEKSGIELLSDALTCSYTGAPEAVAHLKDCTAENAVQ